MASAHREVRPWADPFTDIALDAGGASRWSSDEPELQEAVRRYFMERNEDGEEMAWVARDGAVGARRPR